MSASYVIRRGHTYYFRLRLPEWLAQMAYDDRGNRTSLTRGNGTTTNYGYNGVSWLTSLAQDLGATAYDNTDGFIYSPASQVTQVTRSNEGTYSWAPSGNATKTYSHNGLNQLTAVGSTSISHDGRGNVSGDGVSTFTYDAINRLVEVGDSSHSYTLTYDPLGRLRTVAKGGSTTTFLYAGGQLIAEYNGSAMLRRYVHGPGTDEPLVWYEGAGTSDRRWLHADSRGSIIAVTNSSGTVIETHKYGPYGEPSDSSGSRFQYTGQIIIHADLGLYHYKARAYSPHLGRFLQTDPIGGHAMGNSGPYSCHHCRQ